jgi:uncharacterized protein with PQ loop repeat
VSHSLVALISWAAVTAGTLSAWAQFRRVNAQGIEGVSLATWLMFTLIGGFWICYGALSAHSLAIILGSLLMWPLQLSIVFRLKPWHHRRGSMQATALFVTTCAVPGVIGGWAWCVYGCGLAMTLLRVPQFTELLRTRDASGVSSASWFIGAGCALLWIVYYWNVHLWAPLIATACSGTASLLIGLMALWRHRQEQEEFVRREVFAT